MVISADNDEAEEAEKMLDGIRAELRVIRLPKE
jgi:hypothetical protein